MVESGITGVLSTVWLTYVQALVWLSQRTLTADIALSATAALIILGTITYVLVNGVVLKRFEDKIGAEVMKPAGVLITIGFILVLLVTGSIAWIIPWLWLLALAFVLVLIYWGYALVKTGVAAGYEISAEAKERWEGARSTWASARETEANTKKTMAAADAEVEVYNRVARTTSKIGKFRDWFRKNVTMLKRDLLTLKNALLVAATRPEIDMMQLVGVIEQRLNQMKREKAYETTEEKKAVKLRTDWGPVDAQIKHAEADQKNFIKKIDDLKKDMLTQALELKKLRDETNKSELAKPLIQHYNDEIQRISAPVNAQRKKLDAQEAAIRADYKQEMIDTKSIDKYIKEFERDREKFVLTEATFDPIISYVEAAKAAIVAGNHAEATKPVDNALVQVNKLIKIQKVQDGTFKRMDVTLGKIAKAMSDVAGKMSNISTLMGEVEGSVKKYAEETVQLKKTVDQELAALKKAGALTQVPPATPAKSANINALIKNYNTALARKDMGTVARLHKRIQTARGGTAGFVIGQQGK